MLKNQYNLGSMLLILTVVAVSLGFVFEPLKNFFYANIIINSVILGVLLMGMLYALRTVWVLQKEDNWLKNITIATPKQASANLPPSPSPSSFLKPLREPRLLAILTHFCQLSNDGKITLKALSSDTRQAILHSLDSRLNESRETLRYLVGLLIFLGLLGTFWGLLDTLRSISGIVSNLQPIADGENIFANLRQSLAGPLGGMGTAFSSSLFGLGGSLILGFLGLQAGQAQNRFYNNLESLLTRITAPSHSKTEANPYGFSVMESISEQISRLASAITHSHNNQSPEAETHEISKSLQYLRSQAAAQTELLERLVKSQLQMEINMVESLPTAGQTRQQIEALQAIAKQLDSLQVALAKRDDRNADKIAEAVRVLAKTIAHLKAPAE